MAIELPELGRHRVIVELPELALADLVPVAEVLCQEGFPMWTLPFSMLTELPSLQHAFGRRARIGVRKVLEVSQLTAAVAAGAAFAMSELLLPELVSDESGPPVVLGGLTPSELRAGLSAGAAAVQAIPAEALGTGYARVLPGLVQSDKLILSGRVERHQASSWLENGGLGVCPRDLVDPEAVVEDTLDSLREVLQRWQFGNG